MIDVFVAFCRLHFDCAFLWAFLIKCIAHCNRFVFVLWSMSALLLIWDAKTRTDIIDILFVRHFRKRESFQDVHWMRFQWVYIIFPVMKRTSYWNLNLYQWFLICCRWNVASNIILCNRRWKTFPTMSICIDLWTGELFSILSIFVIKVQRSNEHSIDAKVIKHSWWPRFL